MPASSQPASIEAASGAAAAGLEKSQPATYHIGGEVNGRTEKLRTMCRVLQIRTRRDAAIGTGLTPGGFLCGGEGSGRRRRSRLR